MLGVLCCNRTESHKALAERRVGGMFIYRQGQFESVVLRPSDEDRRVVRRQKPVLEPVVPHARNHFPYTLLQSRFPMPKAMTLTDVVFKIQSFKKRRGDRVLLKWQSPKGFKLANRKKAPCSGRRPWV
jgi:hypothetical protein